MRLFGSRRRTAPDSKSKEQVQPPPKFKSTTTDEKTSDSSKMKDDEATKHEAANSVLTGVNIFEFGAARADEGEIMLAGYCPLSTELESCRWEILPSGTSQAPKFRIIF
ncbi:hypothetical protein O6H91_13G008100 [Diphasiastrum complanatum]|uniref:Uncharacterized protein n=1 Tax=Diphasiastrum complanatum TaxID=34168 RepID=A0ACC2BS80_DIPCM|nr:hypothetical protein O6H91_13G008100 [Diphasiastrum complanatum]